jgi:hypothetical protein
MPLDRAQSATRQVLDRTASERVQVRLVRRLGFQVIGFDCWSFPVRTSTILAQDYHFNRLLLVKACGKQELLGCPVFRGRISHGAISSQQKREGEISVAQPLILRCCSRGDAGSAYMANAIFCLLHRRTRRRLGLRPSWLRLLRRQRLDPWTLLLRFDPQIAL